MKLGCCNVRRVLTHVENGRFSASVHMNPNLLAFKLFPMLLNDMKLLFGSLVRCSNEFLLVLLTFATNLSPIRLPVPRERRRGPPYNFRIE